MKTSTRQNCCNGLAIACATLMMGLTPPSHAAEMVGPDITVRYARSRHRHRTGRVEAAAANRMGRAARLRPLDHGTLASRANARACRQKVAAAAVQKVNHPMLQAVYDSASGARPPVASLGR